MTAPTLFRAMDRDLADIESRPESLGTCYMGSLAGRGGRTPRTPSPWRLYRGLPAGTDTSSGARGREPNEQDFEVQRPILRFVSKKNLFLVSPTGS